MTWLHAKSRRSAVVREYQTDRYRRWSGSAFTQAGRGRGRTRRLSASRNQASNIMIDHHNQLYLVDFGLTRALDSSTTTRIGTLLAPPIT